MTTYFTKHLFTAGLALLNLATVAQNTNQSKFRQLGQELPTPNVYRTAAGAPGHEYYQQKADYQIDITLDDENQKISGEETITYTNNSPDPLEYLWVQLDQNMRAINSTTQQIKKGGIQEKMTYNSLKKSYFYDFDGGFKIEYVKTTEGGEIPAIVNNTMMLIPLDQPLKSGESYSFSIKWWYNINNRMDIGGRSGYEYFEEDENYLYTIAQFFPRMAVYNDVEGWQNKQFLGSGEFTLPFGDYNVNITVPADHVVGATGRLTNPKEVLTEEELERLEKAKKDFDNPVIIVTESEAKKAEGRANYKDTKTWKFYAKNVRDFAFATSRKFIWDAMAVSIGDSTVMAMSYYPKEGNPLWEQYSTRVVAHTLRVYSKYTVDYPYHKAISVHSKWIGMEYPMICFNGGRPEKDGTYSASTKHGMISVIIHEVGHNFFPMIINSDERQWTWMDEGLNTFVQYLTEVEWDKDYPVRRGPAYKITGYMKGDKSKIAPIMTNSESIYQFGNNAYGKPATALNILRETVMGRELFDYSFKIYCERWKFKHPTPADFFRTMEDASGVDLDWYWRGWFYTNDHVDISIDQVRWLELFDADPATVKADKKKADEANRFIGDTRNKESIPQSMVESNPETRDFYNDTYDPYKANKNEIKRHKTYLEGLTDEEKDLIKAGYQFYEIEFSNIGGLIMPVILEFTFEDGSTEVVKVPAEVWLKAEAGFTKTFVFEKEVTSIELDPYLETADTDRGNNYWPPRAEPSRFQLYKSNGTGRRARSTRPNEMQMAR